MMKPGENSVFGCRRYRTGLKMYSGFPDATALLDIFFLVLLFVVLASSFVRVSGVSVALPRVSSHREERLERRMVVSLTPAEKNGEVKVYFRDRLVDNLESELSAVHDKSTRTVIIIRADRAVPFQKVAEVMTIAAKAKLRSFIAVMPDEDKTPAQFEGN